MLKLAHARDFFVLLLLAASILHYGAALAPAGAGATSANLRCEMRTDPMGIDTTAPRLSWELESSRRGCTQSAYQVLVASKSNLLTPARANKWDSGLVPSDRSIQIPYKGRPLQSNEEVFWTVRVWDDAGSTGPWSKPARWTMGITSQSDWRAKWISSGTTDPAPLVTHNAGSAEQLIPVFRKPFELKRHVKRAVANVCGLGQHKLFVNGIAASDTFMDPPWSLYEKTTYYNTYDITELLKAGPNAFGVMLGKGFYRTRGDRRIHGALSDRPLMLIMQALVEYDDGTSEIIATDGSWKWAPGPMTHNAILGGTDYDARLLAPGWAKAGFSDRSWSTAITTEATGLGKLIAASSPSMKVHEDFKPVSISEPIPGHFVYDFGQNASAAPRLTVAGPAGSKIRLTYSEQRQGASPAHNDGKGSVDQAGIGTPAYIDYTLRGAGDERWFSDFFYSGYQYIELTGGVPQGFPNPEGKPVVKELTSRHVRADEPEVGRFSCANGMYNRIDRMVDWSVKSNLGHVLTDCPHREKLGWLEVPYLMWTSIAYRYDLETFGPKVARDIRDSQAPSGEIFTVAPNYPTFTGGFRYTPEWGAAGVFIPWYCYLWYGDCDTLSASYESMRSYVDFMAKSADTDMVPKPGLGDWYDYGHGQPLGPSRFTPTDLTATTCFYDCARIVADAAGILGKPADKARYTAMATLIADGFSRRFHSGDGQYRNTGSPQTANSVALVSGLVPRDLVSSSVQLIIADIRKRGNMQTSGDIGYRYLLRALADSGNSSVICDILDRTGLGSYAYLVNAGWNSLPESWNAERRYSMNHCMLGHIGEWFSADLAGIQLMPGEVAFKTFRIRPFVDNKLTSASAEFHSPRGRIVSAWSKDKGILTMSIAIPANSSAEVIVPTGKLDDVTIDGATVAACSTVKHLRSEPGRVILRVGSGTYRIQCPIPGTGA